MSEKNKSSSSCDLHTCLLINPRPEEEHPDDNPRYADILLPRDARLLVSKNELTVELEKTSEEVEFPTNVKNPYCNEVMDDILKIHRFTVDSNWIGLEFLSTEHPFLWFKFPTAEDVDKLIAVITSYQENIDILCAMSNYNEYMSDIVRRRRISRMRPAGRGSAKSVIVSSRPSVPSNPINSFHQMDEHVLDQVKPEPELKSDTSSMLPSSPEKTLKLKDAVIRAAPEVRTRRPRTKSAIEIATMLAVDIMSPRKGNAQEQKFLVDEPSLNEALRPETAPDVLKNPKMEIEVTPSTQPVTMNTMKSLQNCESIDMDALFTYLERVPSTKNIWQLIVLESETRRFVEERILFSYINGVREVLWHTQLDLLKFDKRKATEFQLLRGHGRSANLLAEGLNEFNPEIVHAENITQNGLQLMKTVDELVRTKLTISPIDYSARKERLETTECAHWEMRLREREEAVWHKIQAQMDSLCAAARKAEEESKMYQEKLRDEMTLAKRQMEEITNLREREETVLHHARQKEGELHQKIRKLSAELKSCGGKVSFDPPSSSESSRSTNSSSASHQTESTSFLKRLF